MLHCFSDKNPSSKLLDATKKPSETNPSQMGPVGGYGMYPFYAQSPYMVPPDHQGNKGPVSQSQMAAQTAPGDYSNKNKEPPLDLMNKPPSSQLNEPPSGPGGKEGTGPPPTQPNKILPHYYSYK